MERAEENYLAVVGKVFGKGFLCARVQLHAAIKARHVETWCQAVLKTYAGGGEAAVTAGADGGLGLKRSTP